MSAIATSARPEDSFKFQKDQKEGERVRDLEFRVFRRINMPTSLDSDIVLPLLSCVDQRSNIKNFKFYRSTNRPCRFL
jgi:hypothetical protein